MTTRGLVVELTSEQRLARLRYLAGLDPIDALDPHIQRDGAPERCPSIYYRLHEHNGGKDPTAPDPADRWSIEGHTFVNRTCDCVGGQAWAAGFDRYQPVRFAHLYDGWINTDSMIMDARGPQRCFAALDAPEPGCMVVCASGSRGHAIGHVGGVIEVPPDWDAGAAASWHQLRVVDVAARDGQANAVTTAIGWFDTHALFVRPVMRS